MGMVLLLTFSGCSQVGTDQAGGTQTQVLTQTQTQTQISAVPKDYQTYKNGTYGFQFIYPTSLAFVTPNYANLEDKIAQLQIPQNSYPKTNFGDAAFAVSATNASSLDACLALNQPEGSDGFKTKVAINGTDFYMTKSSGAGAGNLYEANVYRAFVGNQNCIELNATVHTLNIGNFDPGTVTAVDKTAVQRQLNDILQSFKLGL